MLMNSSETDGLTDKQIRLAEALLRGLPVQEAALEAGYSQGTAGYGAVSSPTFQAALHKCRQRLIATEGASLGYRTMIELCKGEKTPAATKYAAAKYLMGLAGHVEKTGGEGDDVPLHEMSTDQLRAFIARVKQTEAAGGEPPVIKVIEGDNAQPGHNPAP